MKKLSTIVKLYNNSGYAQRERVFKQFKRDGHLTFKTVQIIANNCVSTFVHITKIDITLFEGSKILSASIHKL